MIPSLRFPCSTLSLAVAVFALSPMVFPHLAAAAPHEKEPGNRGTTTYTKVEINSKGEVTVITKGQSKPNVAPPPQSTEDGEATSPDGDAATSPEGDESIVDGNAPSNGGSEDGSEDPAGGEAPEPGDPAGGEAPEAGEPEGEENAEATGEAEDAAP